MLWSNLHPPEYLETSSSRTESATMYSRAARSERGGRPVRPPLPPSRAYCPWATARLRSARQALLYHRYPPWPAWQTQMLDAKVATGRWRALIVAGQGPWTHLLGLLIRCRRDSSALGRARARAGMSCARSEAARRVEGRHRWSSALRMLGDLEISRTHKD